MPEDEEVYADGYIKIPAKRWYHIADALTRQDNLMEAILKVLGAINEKLIAAEVPPVPLAAPPTPPPAPPEWAPLTDRLDIITSEFRDYLSRIRGLPIVEAEPGIYVGALTTWQPLASWNVGPTWKKKYGMLKEVSMTSNNFPNTRFRLRIELGEPLEEKVTLFDELEIPPTVAALTLPFPENRLPYGTWVYLECRREPAGAAITVGGGITGSEWS